MTYQPGTRNPLEGIQHPNPVVWEAPDNNAAINEHRRLLDLAEAGGVADHVHIHRHEATLTITRVDR